MKLSTIQKRNKLNEVATMDAPGPGGAYHNYLITHGCEHKKGETATMIGFQLGPRNDENSIPGVLDTDLLEIVRHRLQCFQAGDFACIENEKALQHIEEALMWLNKRVEDRAERNVLGLNQK